MRITEEIRGRMRRDVQKDNWEKARQFVVRAPVRFIRDSAGHRRCWLGLTGPASGMARDQGWAMRRAI